MRVMAEFWDRKREDHTPRTLATPVVFRPYARSILTKANS